MSQKKQYRPVFSESQILLIRDKFKDSTDFESVTIYRYLCKFTRDIETGYKSSYSAKLSVEESIGLSSVKEDSIDSKMLAMTPAEKREFLYNLWKEGKTLNEEQIKMVQTYRWENSMMTSEEEAKFLEF